MPVTQSHRFCKVFVLLADKSFGQNIHGLLISQGVLKTDFLALDLVPQKMVLHFNMLGVIMELGVACDSDRRLIVDMEDSW